MFEKFMEDLEKVVEEVKKDCGCCACMETLLDYVSENCPQIEFVEKLDTEEHRWYTIDLNVYKVDLSKEDETGKVYYFGVYEVGMLKSESMGLSDTGFDIEFVEVEKVIKETFQIKE